MKSGLSISKHAPQPDICIHECSNMNIIFCVDWLDAGIVKTTANLHTGEDLAFIYYIFYYVIYHIY